MLAFALFARSAAAQQSAASAPPSVSPDVISAGRKIFHGAGNCAMCHGDNLGGGPIAPSLLGPAWRVIDGTYPKILNVVSVGVPNTAMVSHPGGINDAQAVQVATYVYAVIQKSAKP